MTRRITALPMASVAALGVAGVATAHGGHPAKTYMASLAAVNPAAIIACGDLNASKGGGQGKKHLAPGKGPKR